jgi:excisionase family DNA binding protein
MEGRRDRRPHAVTADDVLTPREAAKLLRIGRNTIYDGCARNEIPHRRIGKLIRFSRPALVAWFASCGRSQGAK